MAKKDKIGHIITELMGVALGIIFILYYFGYVNVTKEFLLVVGIATILIDGYFVKSWVKL